MIKLTFADDIEVTPAMEEWRANVEKLLIKALKQMMEDLISYGTVSVPKESD